MLELVLFAGKLLLLALLYLFLLAAVRTGVDMVSGRSRARAGSGELVLAVTAGPRELRGTKLPIRGPIVIGRSPGADIVIADDFVSARHARVSPSGDGAVVEDLGSTNGTLLDGARVIGTAPLSAGSVITLGTVQLSVERS
jgi:pSer/pThr/pTyr-binding forkhead associated (FHA) protein